MKRSRAFRRFHKKRLKEKSKRIFFFKEYHHDEWRRTRNGENYEYYKCREEYIDERLMDWIKRSDHLANCSCIWCSNPRKYLGKTLQEIKSDMELKEFEKDSFE